MYSKFGGCLNTNNYKDFTGTTTTTNTTTIVDDNIRAKWVVNLSSSPLTEAQETLLARGPNFSIVPKCPLKEGYMAKVEEACLKLPPKEAAELRTETSHLLKRVLPNPISAERRPRPFRV